MEDLVKKSFPTSIFENGNYIIPITKKITLSIDEKIKDVYAWEHILV